MYYKLAKELKDAGFKQYGDNIVSSNGEPETLYESRTEDGVENYCYIPTLEELIEACGGKFWRLQNEESYWIASGIIRNTETGGEFNNIEGKTPTEAVANLWLELHEIT